MNLQFTLALRYLGGRKLRTVLTTLAIVFGVLVIFGMNTIMPAFLGSFTANVMAAAGQVDATITNKTGETFPETVADQVASVDGVIAVSATLERSINLPADYFDADPAAPDRATALTLVGATPDEFRGINAVNIVEGRYLETGDGRVAVITQSLAEIAGLGLGDTLTLPTPTGAVDLTIVGITPVRLLPGNEEVLVTLPEAQTILAAPGAINVIDANFDSVNETRRAEIEQAIIAQLGSAYTIGVLQAGAEILTNIGTAQAIFNLLGALALLMGGFIIFNTFRTIIAERRRDIGMLRAVGASRRLVIWLILVEGVIQGVIGTVVGLLLGYALGALVLNAIAPIGQQFLNIRVGSPVVTPGLIVVSVLMGVGITVLAGVIPARGGGDDHPRGRGVGLRGRGADRAGRGAVHGRVDRDRPVVGQSHRQSVCQPDGSDLRPSGNGPTRGGQPVPSAFPRGHYRFDDNDCAGDPGAVWQYYFEHRHHVSRDDREQPVQ